MLKAKLVVVGGDAKAAEISLNLPATIGRGREANLTLPHPLVSRNHCELFERGGFLQVRDLKSLNGTYVDSQRIEATSILKPDQLLTIGNVTFRAVYAAEPDASENGQLETLPAEATDRHASSSHVIESDQVASADSDSKLDPKLVDEDEEIDFEATVPAPSPDAGYDNASSDVMDEQPAAPQPQHSIVAAMRNTVGEVPAALGASLSDVRGQLGDLAGGAAAAAAASGVDGLVVDPNQAPAAQADFSSINLDEKIDEKVSTEDDVLGSFIRKMPR